MATKKYILWGGNTIIEIDPERTKVSRVLITGPQREIAHVDDFDLSEREQRRFANKIVKALNAAAAAKGAQ